MADQQSDDMSVVGQGARIEGTLHSTGSLRIYGHLTGEIKVEGDVGVAAGSDVQADINARSISLAGTDSRGTSPRRARWCCHRRAGSKETSAPRA